MKNVIRVITCFCAVVLSNAATAQALWSELPSGPHAVGYQVLNHYDYGRAVKPKLTFEGKQNEGNRTLPIQISMWYPAVDTNGAKMKYADYVYVTLQKDDFAPLTAEQRSSAHDMLRFPAELGVGLKLSDDELKSAFDKPMMAVLNAQMKEGSFPVIITGSDGGPSHNTLLFEYLASKGYIVLFTPSIARDGTRQVNAAQEVLADRINNMEYLLSFARTLHSANLNRLGVLGVNFDGLTALLYQMKSGEAGAVVSIDGWEGKQGSERTVRNSIYFKPVSFNAPYFTVQQDQVEGSPSLPTSTSIYDELLYADRYYYVFKGLNHPYLVGNLYTLKSIPQQNREAYHYLCGSIGWFFDAYLLQNSEAKKRLDKLANENGLSAGLIKTEIKKAGLPAVPSAAEIETMVMAGEFDKVKKIAIEAMRLNPRLRLIDFNTLNLYNFRFTRANNPEHCLHVRELGTILFPGSARAMKLLGDAQATLRKTADAQRSYKQALKMIDGDADLAAEDKAALLADLTNKLK